MKSFLTTLWTYKSRRFLVFALLLFGVVMLFPLPRQCVFGPRIQGLPWCWWESEIRLMARGNRRPNTRVEALHRALGLGEREVGAGMRLGDPSAVPILLALAEDEDVFVRRFCLQHLHQFMEKEPEAISPTLKRRYQLEDCLECKLIAAAVLWRCQQDPEMLKYLLKMMEDEDGVLRRQATAYLSLDAPHHPEWFDRFAKLLDDPDGETREYALRSMGHFGQRGIPKIRAALSDPSPRQRMVAVSIAHQMKGAALDLVPDLRKLLDDRDSNLARYARDVLPQIDPNIVIENR